MTYKRSYWTISHSKDSNFISLYEYSFKNQVRLSLYSLFEEIDARLTRHWLCGSNLPEIFWRIPLGKAQYDFDYLDENNEPTIKNSIGSALFSIHHKLLAWSDENTKDDLVRKIEITTREAYELVPEWREIFAPTFIEEVLEGNEPLNNIDDWVEMWHDSKAEEWRSLQESLGFTDEEYSKWAQEGNGSLEAIVKARKIL